jgi:hypothetical protein
MKTNAKHNKKVQSKISAHKSTHPKKISKAKSQKNSAKLKPHHAVGFVGVVCALLLVLSFMLAVSVRTNKIQSTTTANELAQKDSLIMTIQDTVYDNTGIPHFWTPQEGNMFVMVNMNIENNSNTLVHFSPVSTLTLVDSKGSVYSVTSAPNMKKGLGGPISPYEHMSGEVGFEVPANENYRLKYEKQGVGKTLPLAISSTSQNK